VPTTRRRIAPSRAGISVKAIQAWQIGDFHALNRELGVRPWQWSPFDVQGTEPDYSRPDHAWDRAMELRRRLIELAGPAGRVGRHGDPLGPTKRTKRA
jgi:hypothetical protein